MSTSVELEEAAAGLIWDAVVNYLRNPPSDEQPPPGMMELHAVMSARMHSWVNLTPESQEKFCLLIGQDGGVLEQLCSMVGRVAASEPPA